jgi:hypothetical protein
MAAPEHTNDAAHSSPAQGQLYQEARKSMISGQIFGDRFELGCGDQHDG